MTTELPNLIKELIDEIIHNDFIRELNAEYHRTYRFDDCLCFQGEALFYAANWRNLNDVMGFIFRINKASSNVNDSGGNPVKIPKNYGCSNGDYTTSEFFY